MKIEYFPGPEEGSGKWHTLWSHSSNHNKSKSCGLIYNTDGQFVMFLSLQYLLFVPWSIIFHLAVVCILVSFQMLFKKKKKTHYFISWFNLGIWNIIAAAMICCNHLCPVSRSLGRQHFIHHTAPPPRMVIISIATGLVINADIRHFHPSHPNSILHWADDDRNMLS